MRRVTFHMANGLTYTLRVTAHQPDTARVSVRTQQFAVGRPLEFDQSSPRTSALEYALGALGAEVVNGVREFARRRRVHIEYAEALVTADVAGELSYLEVVGEQATPRLTHVHIKVFVASADEPAIRRLWTDVLERLALFGTLRRAVPIDLDLIVTH